MKSFFDEIVDIPKYERFSVYAMGLTLGLVLLWVLTAIPSQANNAIIYLVMLIIWGFGLAFDLVWQVLGYPNQMAANGLGKKPFPELAIGVLVAVVVFLFSFIKVNSGFSVVEPSALSFLFVVIAAPIVEANFFRGLIQPVFTLIIEDWIIKNRLIAGGLAMIITSLAFAFFHVNIIGGANILNVGLLAPYFIFGVIATLLVYGTKSIAAEYGFHFVNNLLAFMRL